MQLEAARESVGEAAQKLIDQAGINPIAPAAFGGLQKSLEAINAELAARATGANSVTGGRGDASTAARVADLGAMQGVYERALAKGIKPTADQVQRTLDRNRERQHADDERMVGGLRETKAAAKATGDATKAGALATAMKIAGLVSTTASGLSIAAAASRATTAAIRAKDMSVRVTVPVSVSNRISVRDVGVSQQINTRYGAVVAL